VAHIRLVPAEELLHSEGQELLARQTITVAVLPPIREAAVVVRVEKAQVLIIRDQAVAQADILTRLLIALRPIIITPLELLERLGALEAQVIQVEVVAAV
jgi:DNA-directed RNA polymerase subunit H (RpoH/RPB5)